MSLLNKFTQRGIKLLMRSKLQGILEKSIDYINFAFHFLSCEWVLKFTSHPNGGDIVLIRSSFIATWMFASYIGIIHGIDPSRTSQFSIIQLAIEGGNSVNVFGTIFGAVYLALYSRFSSQWTYLAGLYNQIKAIEAQVADSSAAKEKIAQWKAGFIEDAEDLHLSTKRNFAPIICTWAKESDVEKAFNDYSLGTNYRLRKVIEKCSNASEKYKNEYKASCNSFNKII